VRITNVSDKPLVFSNVLPVKVTRADGTELKCTYSPATYTRRAPRPITVDPGKDMTPPLNASLQWTPDAKTLQLQIYDYECNHWVYDDIKPGKYVVKAEYTFTQSPDPTRLFRVGAGETEPAVFEILEAPDTSKPVQVEPLEFSMIAPVRVAAPAPGEKVDVDLRLRVTNMSNSKPITSMWCGRA